VDRETLAQHTQATPAAMTGSTMPMIPTLVGGGWRRAAEPS
jgi:hypothetical protein